MNASTRPAPGVLATARARLVPWLEEHALLVAGVTAVAAVILSQSHRHLNQDGWLALVGGREVAHHGIPDVDPLTVYAQGVDWIDQQWLSQLIFYGLHQLGGLALVSIFYLLLCVGALAAALAAARLRGGTERHVIWLLPIAAFLFIAVGIEIRTQGFSYPLFVAVLWLLLADPDGRRRRTWLVFPLLVLWANLHGAVVHGMGVVGLYGLVLLGRRLLAGERTPRALLRPVAFCLLPLVCVLITPYGLDVLDYYRGTLTNDTFREVISEWRPVTTVTPVAVPFFALAFWSMWLLGRARAHAGVFEQLVLLALAAASISTVRNVVWFATAALMILPPVMAHGLARRDPAPRRRQLNLAISAASAACLVIATAAVALKPASWFEQGYDLRALPVIADAAARDPRLVIFPDGRFGDWLLWHEPQLAGRIAYDTRLELLSKRQLRALSDLSTVGPDFDRAVRGYELVILDSNGHEEATNALLRQRQTRPVFRGKDLIVARRTTQPPPYR